MNVPQEVREQVKGRLWELADEARWLGLTGPEKAQLYEQWTRAPEIGGVLARYMDTRKVRVYMKDTLLKGYQRSALASSTRPLQALGVDKCPVARRFIKPHGQQLKDGRVICWARAENWKTTVLAVFERAHIDRAATPYAAVLLNASGRFDDPSLRGMVEEAASRLGVERVVWLNF